MFSFPFGSRDVAGGTSSSRTATTERIAGRRNTVPESLPGHKLRLYALALGRVPTRRSLDGIGQGKRNGDQPVSRTSTGQRGHRPARPSGKRRDGAPFASSV